jgi:hypothetical protein
MGRCCARSLIIPASMLIGAGVGLPDLREILAGDCPKARSTALHERCDVHYPDFPALFVPK